MSVGMRGGMETGTISSASTTSAPVAIHQQQQSPKTQKLRRLLAPDPVNSADYCQRLLEAMKAYYTAMLKIGEWNPEYEVSFAATRSKKNKLQEKIKKKISEIPGAPGIRTGCAACNVEQNCHVNGLCKYDHKQAIERIRNDNIMVTASLAALKQKANATNGAAAGRPQADQGSPSATGGSEEWTFDDGDTSPPQVRRTMEERERDSMIRRRAQDIFLEYILPFLPSMKGMKRVGIVPFTFHWEFNFPNPHVHGLAHFPDKHGHFNADLLSSIDTFLASLKGIIVCPGMYFPHFFDSKTFLCPKCNQPETKGSPFAHQGFTYRLRYVYGLRGIEGRSPGIKLYVVCKCVCHF
jgi:hypothetical protein